MFFAVFLGNVASAVFLFGFCQVFGYFFVLGEVFLAFNAPVSGICGFFQALLFSDALHTAFSLSIFDKTFFLELRLYRFNLDYFLTFFFLLDYNNLQSWTLRRFLLLLITLLYILLLYLLGLRVFEHISLLSLLNLHL